MEYIMRLKVRGEGGGGLAAKRRAIWTALGFLVTEFSDLDSPSCIPHQNDEVTTVEGGTCRLHWRLVPGSVKEGERCP